MAVAVLTNGDRLSVPEATVEELTNVIFSRSNIEPHPDWLLEQWVDMSGAGLWLRLKIEEATSGKSTRKVEVGISPLHVVRVDP
jgi:hypothetical protein